MPTLTRDPVEPPLRRPAEAGPWQWPDRHEVTPPPVPAGRPLRDARPLAARWPVEMPERAWPPLPETERPARASRAEVAPPPVAVAAPLRRAVADTPPLPDRASVGGIAFRATAHVDGPAAHPALVAPGAMAAGWAPAAAVPMPRHDPSPSRLAYRLNRLWLTPLVRHSVRFGLPLLLLAALAGGWLASDANRAAVSGWASGLRETVQNQPMFQVHSIEVQARSPEVAQGVTQLLGLSFPVSSWDLDLADLRARAETLDAVQGAWLQVRSGGVLEVRITERAPAMVWRNGAGLELVDATGHRVALLATRAARADLPLIAGEGAPGAIAEAQALLTAAAPLQGRMRGLVRVGNRRWDLVLDRGQRILLPATEAVAALERVVALTEGAQQLLSRDVAIVDMRNPARPTLRLSPDAMTELTRNRTLARGAPRR